MGLRRDLVVDSPWHPDLRTITPDYKRISWVSMEDLEKRIGWGWEVIYHQGRRITCRGELVLMGQR